MEKIGCGAVVRRHALVLLFANSSQCGNHGSDRKVFIFNCIVLLLRVQLVSASDITRWSNF